MKSNRFLRNVITLVSGTALSQLLLLVSAPLLTRLYSTGEFGQLSLFVSIIGILSVSSSLRYNRAVPLPKLDENAKDIIVLGSMIIFFFSFLLFIIVNIIDSFLMVSLDDYPFIQVIPIAVFFAGMFDLYNYWGVRTGAFTTLARSKLLQTTFIITIQILFFSFGTFALVTGHTLGYLFGLLTLLIGFRTSFLNYSFNFSNVKAVAKRYKDFPKYSTWEALANSIGNNSPVILIGFLFGGSYAGLYALTYRVLSLPMNVIGAAIGQAYFSKVAKVYKSDNLGKVTLTLFTLLCNIGFPAALLFFLISPELFDLVFGSDWKQAGVYAQAIVPWLLLVFISSPLTSIISVAEKQKQALVFQVIFLTTKILALYMGSKFLDHSGAIILLSISSSLCLVAFIIWLLSLSRVSRTDVFIKSSKSIIYALLCNLPMIAYCAYSNVNFSSVYYWMAFLLTFAFIIYSYISAIRSLNV
ncbi:oligosaccharide flippase family protein [Photobacterium sanguinicancri]|uniref:oligosaccharide flippase family protein n=1 Tax=Photobacterium sanguinicancri TaxID=875932 RepID=UPI003D10F90D